MEKQKVNGVAEQGSEPMKAYEFHDVLQFVKTDIAKCAALMDAINQDPSTVEAIARYLHGRYENHRLRQELGKQGDLDFKESEQ